MIDARVPRLSPRASGGGSLVSVVMPTYRRSHQIGESIRSLQEGEWSDFELLVRDDGDGSDGTEEAVRAVSEGDPRVRYHRNQRRFGMPGNLNAGIMDSRGALIAVCHDHDLYRPPYLAVMVQTLRHYPNALFVHCALDAISQDGTYLRSWVGDWPELSPGSAWLRFMLGRFHCPVSALTLVRRETHERFGLYDLSYGFVADIEMWMRLALHGDVAYVRNPLIRIRQREEDHAASANGTSLLSTVARIHRQYIPCAYQDWEMPLRRLLLEMRLAHQISRHAAAKIVHRLRDSRRG